MENTPHQLVYILITHQMIADKLNIPISSVKTEHLSFFNKHPKEMESSPLYPYYKETEPQMMKNLINEKYASTRKHKMTSQKLFEKEGYKWEAIVKAFNKKGLTEADALKTARLAKILQNEDYNFKKKEPILWQPKSL